MTTSRGTTAVMTDVVPPEASACVIASSVRRDTDAPRATRARSASISSAEA